VEDHVIERLLLRAGDKAQSEKTVIKKTLLGLLKKGKDRKLPNTFWFRRIRKGKRTLGYFCGQGVEVRTYLHEDMVPRGVEI